MKRIPGRWVPLVAGVAIALLGIVGIMVLWGGFPIRWSPDSVHYFAAAESISSGSGYTGIDGGPTVVWPPGYPLILSLGSLVSGGTNAVARAVNGLSYIVVVVISTVILWRVVRNPILRWVGVAGVVVSPALSFVFVHVWSDLLFTAFVMGAIGLVLLSLERDDRRLLAFGGVVAGLAVVVRYLGVSIGITGATAVLLLGGVGRRRRLEGMLLFGLGAFGIPGMIFTWNAVRTGTITGERLAACAGIGTIVTGVLDVVGTWFAFGRGPLLGLAFFAIVLVASVMAWIVETDRATRSVLLVFAVFVVVYLAMLVAGSISANVDPPDFRLLLPVYVPLVILAIASLGVFVDQMRDRGGIGGWVTRVVIVVAVAFLVIGPVLVSIDTARAWSTGIRIDIRHRAEASAILAEDLAGDGHVLSNRPHFVYLQWGGLVERAPFLQSCASDQPHSHVLDESALERLVGEYGYLTLVWFDTGDGPLPAFERIVSQRLAETEDGVVLRLTGVVASEM